MRPILPTSSRKLQETAMRRYEISPAIVAALRSRTLAASFQEVGVPLRLELPVYREPDAPFHEVDAEDGRVEAEGFLFDPEEDDDFY
jgi:hypothetical protein